MSLKIQIEIESMPPLGWWARITSPHGGRELKSGTFDEMLEQVRAAHDALMGPPPVPAPAAAMPEPQPQPSVPMRPALPVPLSKRAAARARKANDEAILAQLSPASRDAARTRKAEAGSRRGR